jgi:1-acyl-sn-glycerol-3-phosphate acyltransferase
MIALKLYCKYFIYSVLLILVEIPVLSLVLLTIYIAPLPIMLKIINYHTKFFFWLFRINTKYTLLKTNYNNQAKIGNMYIANHISWIDILLMMRIYYIRFIAKAELKRWPIFGKVMIKYGTIFVTQSHNELRTVNVKIGNNLLNGNSLVVFPEGETTDGKTVYNFKTAIFQVAIDSKSQIIPVVINYLDKSGKNIAPNISYSKKNLFQSIKNTVKNCAFNIEITELSAINAEQFANRNELRFYVEQKIKEHYLKVFSNE